MACAITIVSYAIVQICQEEAMNRLLRAVSIR